MNTKNILYRLLLVFNLLAVATVHGDSWLQKASIPSYGRQGASSFVIGSKGYIAAWAPISSPDVHDLWEYDPALNTWSQKASFDTVGRSISFAFSINGKGYLGGGFDEYQHVRKDFWEYDPILNLWSRKNDLDTAIKGGTSFVINNKAYVVWGEPDDGTYSNLVYEYNPTGDIWTRKADFPAMARTEPSSFVLGNLGYVGFGTDFDTNFSDWYSYNPVTDSWDTIASLDFWQGRWAATGFSLNNMGYVMGGFSYLDGISPKLWQYNPITNTWNQKANFVNGRFDPASFVINNRAFAGTGSDTTNNTNNDWWEYIPDPTSVSELTQQSNFNIQPNPSSGIFQLKSQSSGEINISIYDYVGNWVLEKTGVKESDTAFNLSNYPKGIYFVKVSQGDKTTTHKIILM